MTMLEDIFESARNFALDNIPNPTERDMLLIETAMIKGASIGIDHFGDTTDLLFTAEGEKLLKKLFDNPL